MTHLKNESPVSITDNIHTTVLAALKAIVAECSDYPTDYISTS